jgi:hypothetical protein
MISAAMNPITPDSGDLAQPLITVSVVLIAAIIVVVSITIWRRRAKQR